MPVDMQITMEQWLGERVQINKLKLPEGQQALILKCPDCKQLRMMLNPYPMPECKDFLALELPCEKCALTIITYFDPDEKFSFQFTGWRNL